MDQLDVYRTSDVTPTWSICDLAIEVSDSRAHRLTLRLLRDDVVEREEGERYFMRPEQVRVWLELRAPGAADDREARLATRLSAISMATKLGLPVLETRNGVFCKTPDAFAAWCSRSKHPDTVLLGETEHVTAPKRPNVVTPAERKRLALKGTPVPAKHVPLPQVGKWVALWRKWRKMRTYIVTIPAEAKPHIIHALVEEITSTFGDSNVIHEPHNQRLLIVGKDSVGTVEVVSYYRRRAHPERMRMAGSGAMA